MSSANVVVYRTGCTSQNLKLSSFQRHLVAFCAVYYKKTVVRPCKKTLYCLLTNPFSMAVAVAPLSWRKKFAEKIVF
jgi:hypothetical protein